MKKIAQDILMKTLNTQIEELADSVQGLAEITDETLNTTVELTKHIVSLQEDFITIINRLNEVELATEQNVKKLFVSPVMESNGAVQTPYPKKTRRYRRRSKLQRVVTNLKRIIRNHATP